MSRPKSFEEPPMSEEDWADLRRGVALFNRASFWHSHEAWEAVWLRKRAFASHLFFKGLIQLAAAHHQRTRGRFEGMVVHMGRARAKLAPFSPVFLGIAVEPLLTSLAEGETEARRLGKGRMGEFDRALIPVILFSELGKS